MRSLTPIPAPPLNSPDLEEVLHQSALVAAELCQANRCAVFLLAEGGDLLHCAALHPERGDWPPVPMAGDHLLGRVVRSGVAALANGPESFSAADAPLLRRFHVEALAVAPILLAGRPLGGLVAAHLSARRFGEGDLHRLERVARNIAVALERARLYRQATERIAELSLLHEVGRAFNESLELSVILDTCADQLAALIGASNCYILLSEGDHLRGVAGTGLRRAELNGEDSVVREPSLALQAVREGRPLVAVDARNDPRVNPAMARRFNEKSVLALPMTHRGRSIGAVVFDEQRRHRLFTPAEIERASLVVGHLAAALDNARLYEDLRRSYAELAQAQERLVQRERLAALGELAAQVAHEVRNPLGAVFNVVGELRRSLGPLAESGPHGYLLRVLSEEAERINRIVGDLIDFARPMELSPQTGPLAATLEDALAAAARGPGLTVTQQLDPRLTEVALDPRLMRQAFLNLFQNAFQALPGGGQVHIGARVIERANRTWAELTVEDSGPGVDLHMRDRIFEPFFTTKAAGIGLGLAVVKRIAEAHQGEVRVGEAVGGGAAFVLAWPADPLGLAAAGGGDEARVNAPRVERAP